MFISDRIEKSYIIAGKEGGCVYGSEENVFGAGFLLMSEVNIEPFIRLTAPVRKKAVKKLGLEEMLRQIDNLK
ncbi:MAG: hypothetical protein JRJ02_03125 [Deltaproteobacteria bacterium]|nr:hypothetical protein [Deltaproteobacteria bacterium]